MAPSTASSSSATDSPSLASKALNQAKYVVTGGALVYYLSIGEEFTDILHTSGLPSIIALASLAATLVTISIFFYLLVYLPRFKGINPDYHNWRLSRDLSSVVPILTGTIVSGWSLLAISLATWSRLNVLQSLAGALGSYALMFGLMGMIPTPARVGSSKSHRAH
ncbi:hypothetical protein M407DRAFT_240538 [Tulasnella calospora MUT 4182]|uniref:Uncharacterized protein n=1 Tax=Tulasnella calospora MUT 4182 TaxID=1051891 RepID=A0A0C3QXC6_9AGAM|nr:hypothetical protein M407DRAFT_240538 [Tulasnella calospora MUT 4182]